MSRIIAGQWGGRRLETPRGEGTRPTSDRVREALFSSLESHFGSLEELHVLDLFAGSGALALESLSRGALSADLIERDAKAVKVMLTNVRALGAERSATVHRMAAERFVAGLSATPSEVRWDLVLIDPPYEMPVSDVRALVSDLDPWVDPAGLFVVERPSRQDFEWPEAMETLRQRRYGETTLWYGR